MHKEFEYFCNQCSHKTKTKSSLDKHALSMHVGIQYPCEQCDAKLLTKGNLERHMQNKHEQ